MDKILSCCSITLMYLLDRDSGYVSRKTTFDEKCEQTNRSPEPNPSRVDTIPVYIDETLGDEDATSEQIHLDMDRSRNGKIPSILLLIVYDKKEKTQHYRVV